MTGDPGEALFIEVAEGLPGDPAAGLFDDLPPMRKWEPAEREKTINSMCDGFITTSAANRAIYRRIIETLWPPGSGLPGPVVDMGDIRAAINDERLKMGKEPYADPFRRFRELYGEEGMVRVKKKGATYQLLDASMTQKRKPRETLSQGDWEAVKQRSDFRCAVCGKPESATVHFQPDHKIPRSRQHDTQVADGAWDSADNHQALCNNCNIHKSVACRGCGEDCLECPWAFPERVPSVTIRGARLQWVIDAAWAERVSPQVFVDGLLDHAQGKIGGEGV